MAVEEYLFKNFKDDIFMLWRNDNAVIVGKHQNTLAEINIEYVKEKYIKVVRRLSGGGAVFHDLGNLNFTFIMNGDEGKLVDFRKYTQPIIDVLQKIGVNAVFEGRNDLTIDGKKFSGNAVHIVKNRVLQHGTLLFSSIIKDLSEALKVNPLKFTDKAVKSVRSRVTNISENLSEPMNLDTFSSMIMDHIKEMYPESQHYILNDNDSAVIQNLSDNKYSTWDWNFGYQAKYDFEKLIHTNGGNIEFHLNVYEGIIKNCKIFGDYFNTKDTTEIEEALTGIKHEEIKIREALSKFEIDEYFKNVTIDELILGMF
jgi:lipoate-protein ligase A